jgi:predicted kinase
MVPKFIMLIGVPGSGKSTKAKELAEEYNATIFSSDSYRVKLCGNESDQTKNDEVFKLLYADLKEALQSGTSCILDATNISFKSRSRTLEYFKSVSCERIAYVVNTPVSQCILQDLNRSRVVGEKVL